MLANYELREYEGEERIWAGKYMGLINLPHWHIDCELLYVDKGETLLSVNEHSYRLGQGAAAFIESGSLHHIQCDPGSIVTVFLFSNDLMRPISKCCRLQSPILSHGYYISSVFYAVSSELSERRPFYALKAQQLITSLLIDIYRNEELCGADKRAEPRLISKYKALLEEIERNSAYVDFASAAKFMGLNSSYFSRCFKKLSGMSFSRYLNTVRVEKAVELLRSANGMSVAEIATSCGYDTLRHFNRVFKEITGHTPTTLPGEYRIADRPVKTVGEAFDPTLNSSQLLGVRHNAFAETK